MDWEPYLFAGSICLMVFIFALILLVIDHRMEAVRDQKMRHFLKTEMLNRTGQMITDAIGQSLDMMPEKIMEVKKTIDGE